MATGKLNAELDRIFQERDRENMAPTIAALRPILEKHPHDPRVLYEVGGASTPRAKRSWRRATTGAP